MIIFIYYILYSFKSSNFFVFLLLNIKGYAMTSLIIAFGALAFIVIRLVLLIYTECKRFDAKDKKENAV